MSTHHRQAHRGTALPSTLSSLAWASLTLLAAGCAASQEPAPASSASGPSPASANEAANETCVDGEQKQHEDGCNSCTCSGGVWGCTRKMCLPTACTDGQDQSCNEDPSVSSLWGSCQAGVCVCGAGFELNEDTGRCRPAASL